MSNKNEAVEKPLEKMTVTELREVAAGIPDITGASGMKKDELLAAIKTAKGIEDETPKAGSKPRQTGGEEMDLKQKIKLFKTKRTDALTAGDKKAAKIFRRRISRLKKRSRKAA